MNSVLSNEISWIHEYIHTQGNLKLLGVNKCKSCTLDFVLDAKHHSEQLVGQRLPANDKLVE